MEAPSGLCKLISLSSASNFTANKKKLRDSKLYVYKPPVDLGIRSFDISLTADANSRVTADSAEHSRHVALNPDLFEAHVRSLLFKNNERDLGPTARFRTRLEIREFDSLVNFHRDYLALLCETELVLCRKRSVHLSSRGLVKSHSQDFEATGDSDPEEWQLDCVLHLRDIELELDNGQLILKGQSFRRKFTSVSEYQLKKFFDQCSACQLEVLRQPRPATAPTLISSKTQELSLSDDSTQHNESNSLSPPVITELGTLLRRLLISKSPLQEEPILGLLIPTIGFLSSPETFILELAEQIRFLGDSIDSTKPVTILDSIISISSSILLRSETVEALLGVIGLVPETEQATLRALLWSRRAAISAVISMESLPPDEDADEPEWIDELRIIHQTGLRADTVLGVPANIFAAQLRLFHQYYLANWNPSKDRCLFYGYKKGGQPRNPLIFNHRNMHFLTWIILSQVLCLESAAISTERRAEICSRWILIGVILKRTGDMTGWLATAMALCSPSVVRLKEMWTGVECRLRMIVQKEWSPIIFDLFRRSFASGLNEVGNAHVLAPDVTNLAVSIDEIVPFYGDLCDALDTLKRKVNLSEAAPKSSYLDTLTQAYEVLQTALENYNSFLERVRADSNTKIYEPTRASSAFQECFRQLHSIHLEHSDICSSVFMEASLRCESACGDLHARLSDNGNVIGTSSYMPLLFVDQLPAYRLFDIADILAVNDIGKRPRPPNSQSNSQNKSLSSHSGGVAMRRLNSFPPTQRPGSHTTGHDLLDEATRIRTAASVSQWKMLKHVRDIAGVSDQAMILASGKLILKDFDGEKQTARKRPQSVLMEARKRDSIVSRRSSLQLPDSHALDDDNEVPIRSQKLLSRRRRGRELVIKAASIDMLFDLLLLDIEDLPGLEVNVAAQQINMQEASLDRSEYIRIFLLSYKSYCSATDLLGALTLRMLQVFKASQIRSSDHTNTIDWIPETSHESSEIDWRLVENILAGICEVFSTWLANIPTDFTSSQMMQSALYDFFQAIEQQIEKLAAITSTNRLIGSCQNLLKSNVKKLRRQALRVCHTPQSWPSLSIEYKDQGLDLSSVEITYLTDWHEIYQDLKQLDEIVEIVLQGVTLADWMICYEILEMQALNPHGFLHNITELIALDQDITIHDSLWLLQNSATRSGTTLLQSMPHPIRELVRLRSNITHWTTNTITQPDLKLGERVERIEYFLRMLGLSAKCMSQFDIKVTATEHTTHKTQIVPSLVAAAITAGLHHPDSRSFSLAWSLVAQRQSNEDQITSIIPLIPEVQHFSESTEPIVPCIAWIIDRMLEIACYIPNRLLDNPSLLNFDKRRYLCNLLSNLELDGLAMSRYDMETILANHFQFLLGVLETHKDRKILRMAAAKENVSTKGFKLVRPFGRLVQLEHEKARRDLRLREQIGKQLRDLDKLELRKKNEVVKLLDSKRPQTARSRYGMTSLLRAVRPLSVAISGTWTPEKHSVVARIVPPSELPVRCITIKGTKPALTIDLVNSSTVLQDRTSHTFKLCTEDGLDVIFQAPSSELLDSWIRQLDSASLNGRMKRVSIIREDAKLASIEEAPQFSPRNSVILTGSAATFGMDLAALIRRDACSIPKIATLLINEIESRGLQEIGIYRISGSLSTINKLKRSIDTNPSINATILSSVDINAIAGLFKLWLRELPEPLMTYALYTSFLATLEIEEYGAKLLALKELVHRLPVPNFSMLKRLIEHLEKVTDYEACNHMYAHNLAIIFGPNILQPTPSNISLAASMSDLGKIQTVIRNIVLQCHWVFSTEDAIDIDFTKINPP